MNENNLIPLNKRSKSEQRAIAKKGGEASGRARNVKKNMKEQLKMLMELPVNSEKTKQQLKTLGVDIKNMDNKMLINVALFQKAVAGDTTAYKMVLDILDEVNAEQQSKDTGAVNALMSAIKGESGEDKC